MENKEKKPFFSVAVIIAVIFVVFVVMVMLGSLSNTNNQQQSNQTAVETPAQTFQPETQTPPQQAPVQTPTQSLQSQCEAMAKKVLDSYTPNRQSAFQTQFGSDALVQFTHSDHYNKSMGKCIMSLHEQVFSSKYNLQVDYYYLYKLDNTASAVIGELWYSTTGTRQTISQCEVNTLPCSSTDAYASMTAPYLNN